MDDFTLTIPELHGIKIRRTKDGEASILDLLRAAGCAKTNVTQTWKRISDAYPDVMTRCHHVHFLDSKGRKNKATPVTNIKGWLVILAVLPGAMGASYREKAANLVVRYLRGDADLALDILYRKGNEAELKRAKRRIQVRDTNKQTAALAISQKCNPGEIHNKRYEALYDKNSKQLKKDAAESLSVDLRDNESSLDYMSEYDLTLNYLANMQAEMLGDPNAVAKAGQTLKEQHEKVFKTTLTPTWEPPMTIKAAQQVDNGQLSIPA